MLNVTGRVPFVFITRLGVLSLYHYAVADGLAAGVLTLR